MLFWDQKHIYVKPIIIAAVKIMTISLLVAGCVYRAPYYQQPGYAQPHPYYYDYYYYPSVGVYYQESTGYYYYQQGGRWIYARTLPNHLRIDIHDRVKLRMQTDRPYTKYNEHHRLYPPHSPANHDQRNYSREKPSKPYDGDSLRERQHEIDRRGESSDKKRNMREEYRDNRQYEHRDERSDKNNMRQDEQRNATRDRKSVVHEQDLEESRSGRRSGTIDMHDDRPGQLEEHGRSQYMEKRIPQSQSKTEGTPAKFKNAQQQIKDKNLKEVEEKQTSKKAQARRNKHKNNKKEESKDNDNNKNSQSNKEDETEDTSQKHHIRIVR